jgi:hypothetical protein
VLFNLCAQLKSWTGSFVIEGLRSIHNWHYRPTSPRPSPPGEGETVSASLEKLAAGFAATVIRKTRNVKTPSSPGGEETGEGGRQNHFPRRFVAHSTFDKIENESEPRHSGGYGILKRAWLRTHPGRQTRHPRKPPVRR